jgi:hypothetical protein
MSRKNRKRKNNIMSKELTAKTTIGTAGKKEQVFIINGKQYSSIEEYRAAIASPKKEVKLNYDKERLNNAIKRVWDAYSNDDLKAICQAQESEFDWAGEYHATPSHSFYYYKRTGSPILAVGHLDSVQRNRDHFKVSSDGMRIWSPVLDDRLGVYAITKLLPAMGIITDVLLTTGEESGCSTAKEFGCPVIYNWMVEFDRGGGDAVTYQFDSEPWESMLESYGYEVGHGIYSDIDDLGHVGCCAVNIGVGYQQYHSMNAYFDLGVFIRNVAKFVMMYEDQSAQMFYHSAPKYKYGKYSKYGYYDNDWYTDTTAAPAKSTVGLETLTPKPAGYIDDFIGSETDNALDEMDNIDGLNDQVSFSIGETILGYQLFRDLSIDSPEDNTSEYLIVSIAPFIMENTMNGKFWAFQESTWGWEETDSPY